MSKQKDFETFLTNIEPSESTIQYISSIQNNLREYLQTHKGYGKILIETFLSGSYAKHTSIRPVKGDKKRDVDIIVVTRYEKTKSPIEVLDELYEVLKESSLYESVSIQRHSVGVEMSQISVDIVPVIVDVEEDVFLIGDSEDCKWSLTDPKGHKEWSTSVNKDNNGKFKPLVKIFKWWRRINCPNDIKYPKGITLEKIIADNLGDSSASTEDLVIETMNNIVSSYKDICKEGEDVPKLDDPSNKVSGDLLEGYTPNDFYSFLLKIDEHIKLLNDEGIGNETWRKILGIDFPKDTTEKCKENIRVCQMASHRKRIPWPISHDGVVFIIMKTKDKFGNETIYENNGKPLEKGCSIIFRAVTGAKAPFIIKWQITNTGDEARRAGCLRGDFEDSDNGMLCKNESTQYAGSHSVQCFVIKKGVCIAKSNEIIINIKQSDM